MSIDSWTIDSMVHNKNRDLPKGEVNHLGYDIPKLADGTVRDVAGSDQLICVSLKYDDGRKVSLSVGHETLLYQSTRLGVGLTIRPFRKSINHSLIKRLRRGQTISVLRWADSFLSECPSQFDHGNTEILTRACVILARFARKSVTAYAGNNAAGCLIRIGDMQENPGAAALLAIARWVNWRATVDVTGTQLHPPIRDIFFTDDSPSATLDELWVALAGEQDPRQTLGTRPTAHEQIAAHRLWKDEILPKGYAVRAEIARRSHLSSRELEAMVQTLGPT